jgi:hypothetical protein
VVRTYHIAKITRAPLQPDRFQRASQGVNTVAVEAKLVRIDCLAFSDLCEAFFKCSQSIVSALARLMIDCSTAGVFSKTAEVTLSDQRSARGHGTMVLCPVPQKPRWHKTPTDVRFSHKLRPIERNARRQLYFRGLSFAPHARRVPDQARKFRRSRRRGDFALGVMAATPMAGQD